MKKKTVYLCEVATHLETGLQYTKYSRPDNVNRFIKKFERDIGYAKRNFSKYEHVYMLWSPIIKIPKKEDVIINQMRDIKEIQRIILEKFNVKIKAVLNEEYLCCIYELRKVAKTKTEAMSTTIMRFLQIDEKTTNHVNKLKKKI